VLDPQESLAFFARVLGEERVAAEHAAALRVAELCGRLPLALRIAAVRLALRPSFGFADVEAELAPEEDRLAELSRGSDEFAAVRHVFSWSYAKLTPPQQRTFRRLGLHRGPAFGAAAAEALLGVPRDEARDLLDALTEAHLLEEDTPGRFRFHDLLRLYAQDRCHAQEPPAEAARVAERLLAWYVATGENADRALNDGREQVLTPIAAPEGVRPTRFADADAALAWFDAEYANVLDVAQQAADSGLFTIASRVPIVLRSYFQRRSQWPEWLEVQRVGLDAARAAGDGPAEAWLLSGLGDVYDDLERYDEALACHTRALEAHRRLGDRRGEATDLNNMGVALDNLERYVDAVEHYTGAERLFADLGHLGGQAMALNNMGAAHMVCGDTDRAADCYRRSLEIRRAADDDAFGEAMTLHNLGEVHEERGEWEQAAASYRESLAVHRRVGHLRGEARALHRLGAALAALGDREAARGSWERALEIFEDIGDGEADDVTALIDGCEADPSP
jgi:tetratricopeptide (TPR) repeat protein